MLLSQRHHGVARIFTLVTLMKLASADYIKHSGNKTRYKVGWFCQKTYIFRLDILHINNSSQLSSFTGKVIDKVLPMTRNNSLKIDINEVCSNGWWYRLHEFADFMRALTLYLQTVMWRLITNYDNSTKCRFICIILSLIFKHCIEGKCSQHNKFMMVYWPRIVYSSVS